MIDVILALLFVIMVVFFVANVYIQTDFLFFMGVISAVIALVVLAVGDGGIMNHTGELNIPYELRITEENVSFIYLFDQQYRVITAELDDPIAVLAVIDTNKVHVIAKVGNNYFGEPITNSPILTVNNKQ